MPAGLEDLGDDMGGRIIFAEVSKVRHYHSTVLAGFVKAWYHVGADRQWGVPVVYAHSSFLGCLDADVIAAVDARTIAVIDPDKRWLIRKTFLEAFQAINIVRLAKPSDVVLLTTIFPSAMPFVEFALQFMRNRRVVVLQHNEVEEACTNRKPKFASYAFTNLVWHKVRPRSSRIRIAVLGGWIANGVRRTFYSSLGTHDVIELPMPIMPYQLVRNEASSEFPLRCAFIGFNTPAKGYSVFKWLAEEHPEVRFFHIGGGVERNIVTNQCRPLHSTTDFHDALSKCDIAILPNTDGYEFILSAAATDAIAAGLHLLCSNRGCYRAFKEAFGPEVVTICDDQSVMSGLLDDREWWQCLRTSRQQRLAKIESSEFGLDNVGLKLKELMHISI